LETLRFKPVLAFKFEQILSANRVEGFKNGFEVFEDFELEPKRQFWVCIVDEKALVEDLKFKVNKLNFIRNTSSNALALEEATAKKFSFRLKKHCLKSENVKFLRNWKKPFTLKNQKLSKKGHLPWFAWDNACGGSF